jgi:hypothetical protein
MYMSVWVGFIPYAGVGGAGDPVQWVGCPGRRVHWSRVLVLDRNVTSGLTAAGAQGAWHPIALRVAWGSTVVVVWGGAVKEDLRGM